MNNEKAGRTKPTLDQAQLALDRLDEEISGKVVRILFRKRLKDRLKDKEAKKLLEVFLKDISAVKDAETSADYEAQKKAMTLAFLKVNKKIGQIINYLH